MEQRKEWVSVAFCPPTGAWDNFPDRLTDEVFQTLKATGINRIFAFGMDDRLETIEIAFQQCEKYGIGYLPSVPSARAYCRILSDEEGKPWKELTQAEKDALDQRFVKEVRAYASRPAFKGILFEDECGYLSFDGVAHAKKVFDKHFPGYEFHANFFSYSANDAIFWGGMAFHEHPENMQKLDLPFSLTGDMEITFANRFRFYDVLVEGLLSKAHFELISQDKYPFEEFWPEVPTSVHIALFELNAFLKKKSLEHGSRFYNYMQVGQWSSGNRKMDFGEMALQINVTAAYGAEGFGWFPGVFPLDWRGDGSSEGANGSSAFIDLYGRPTVYADWVGRIHKFLKQFCDDVLNSELLGVTAYGTYDNGFDWEQVRTLPDSECIYHGNFPDILSYRDEQIQVESGNQVMVSTFERDGKRRYYMVNLSSVYENPISVTLPAGQYRVYSMERAYDCGGTLEEILQPGCALYIVKENEQ